MSPCRFNTSVPLTAMQIKRESNRRLVRLHLRIAEDVRRLRLDCGLTIAELARAVDLNPGHLWHIENGDTLPSIDVLNRLGIALGADLSVRYFAGAGPRLYDRVQAAMIEGFLRALHPRWRRELEAPVGRPSRGVLDAVLTDPGVAVVAGEVQSDLRRLEQQVRWHHEKAVALASERLEDVSELLVLRSTRATRELARVFETTLQTAYPARAADAVASLAGVAKWPGAAIIWMRVERGEATLMQRPPPGVALGR